MQETGPEERLTPETLDEVLEWVLAAHPDASIAAITPEGMNTEMPEGFDVGSREVVSAAGSPIMYVAPRNLSTVVDMWQEARDVGASMSTFASNADSDEGVTVYLVDAMHSYGVYFSITVGDQVAPVDGGTTVPARQPTKLGRMRKDEVAIVVELDDAAVELLGFEPDEIVGRRSLDFIHPDDHARAVDCWMALLAEPGGLRTVRYRHRRKDGSYVWCDVSHRNLLNSDEGCVVADLIDVSKEMSAEEALREREQLLARLTEEFPLGVLQIDADREVVFANQRYYEIVGTAPGSGFAEQLATMPLGDRVILEEALERVLCEGIDHNVRLRVQRPGETEHRVLKVGLRALTADDGRVAGAVNWVEDVTESTLLAIELETRATRDALTGCYNRASMMSMLEEILQSDFYARSGTALLFLDVDQFKSVNDELGHAAGDEVLRMVAERAARVTRDHDMLGRIGGDEFLVVAPGMSDEAGAMGIAERMSEVVNQPVEWAGRRLDLQVSIGVVWCAAQRLEADWLVAQADRVMYESKRGGVGRPIGRPASMRLAS